MTCRIRREASGCVLSPNVLDQSGGIATARLRSPQRRLHAVCPDVSDQPGEMATNRVREVSTGVDRQRPNVLGQSEGIATEQEQTGTLAELASRRALVSERP